jgi:Rrf2 family cysteine metabolism transcriptional repressor
VISVTSKSRYAVLALAELSRSDGNPVPIAQIAERRDMPVQFLEQLFSTLRRDGLLVSQRGVRGGYKLARPASEITVLEVVQSLDGKIGEEANEAGGIWADGVEALRDVFSRTTIEDIAAREEQEAQPRMYYI